MTVTAMSLSLGDKNVTVPLKEVHGDEQNHTHLSSTERLSSTSSQTYSIEVGNNVIGGKSGIKALLLALTQSHHFTSFTAAYACILHLVQPTI